LLDLTRGYATFAGGGKLSTPYTVLEIKRPNGDVIYDRQKDAQPPDQVVPEDKIAELNSMLKAVVKQGTARKADLGYAPQGGKTGTNQSYRDAWFVGFTAHNVTGVWVGNDDFSPMEKVTGGLIPAPTWKKIMDVAELGQKPEGLAGIPMDETYTAVAALPPETPQPADETPATPATDTANLTSEAEAATPEPAPQDDTGVAVVLKDLSSLFEKEQPATGTAPLPKRRQASIQRPRSQSYYRPRPRQRLVENQPQVYEPLVLPEANTRSKISDNRFIDGLFNLGDRPRKKRKKKFIFGF
jgi:penicillin-binding protein 1A